MSRSHISSIIDKLPFQELGDILLTFLLFNQDVALAEQAQSRILKQGRKMTVDDCISLMNAYMMYDSSEDLWTVFDIIIGRNIRKVERAQIIPILHMFSKAPFSREKLFQLFVHKIKEAEFGVSDLATITRIYGEIKYSKTDIFKYLDSQLANRIFEMSDEDVTNTLIGFINPDLNLKTDLIDNLETHIQEILPKISLHNTTTLLLRYGQLRRGSKIMVESCLKRVHHIYSQEIAKTGEVTPIQLIMTLYSFNLVGADAKYYFPILKPLVANKGNLDFDRLNEIYSILKRFEEYDEFLDTLIEIKYEIEKYNPDGTRKQIFE